jgi:hypothetical protein
MKKGLPERRDEERSCQFAGSVDQLGAGSVSPPRWMQAHLTECLSCLDDFTRLQRLGSRPEPVHRRWLGNGIPAPARFWLLPIVAILVLFLGLIVLTQGSAVAPFIYAGW